jgi:hypothetical protein
MFEWLHELEKDIKEFFFHRRHHKHRLVLTTFINNFQIQVMSLTLAANQSSVGTLGLVDNTTGAAVSATFANVQAVPSDATLFSATVNADGTITVAGIAAGQGTLSVSADATYTDSNTGQSVTNNETATIGVLVNAVVSPEGVSLVVTFSTPQIKK